ncbi:PIN domain-containing protein [Candidatus Gottesmanbacteria bacterium]|nr:PIN domain-containing protein [Candidatus Gottesmanbacteria bacterium]
MNIKVFVDSDVIISSLLSDRGAAYALLQSSLVSCFVSQYSVDELRKVVDRLSLEQADLNALIKQLSVARVKESLVVIRSRHARYVHDDNDSHIIAGAITAKAAFLATYNMKHYRCDFIKEKLGILVYTPAQILQYLRSRN